MPRYSQGIPRDYCLGNATGSSAAPAASGDCASIIGLRPRSRARSGDPGEYAAMCGIVGYIGPKKVVPLILDGLRRLEYRGYDSAGIAVVGENGKLEIRRAPGKLRNLEESIRLTPLDGVYGIGHTRWATHGRPTEENAHPHRDCTGEIVVVHNGIVENYVELKKQLVKEGHKFVTETDTEIIAHLVEKFSKDAAAGRRRAQNRESHDRRLRAGGPFRRKIRTRLWPRAWDRRS